MSEACILQHASGWFSELPALCRGAPQSSYVYSVLWLFDDCARLSCIRGAELFPHNAAPPLNHFFAFSITLHSLPFCILSSLFLRSSSLLMLLLMYVPLMVPRGCMLLPMITFTYMILARRQQCMCEARMSQGNSEMIHMSVYDVQTSAPDPQTAWAKPDC